MRKLYGSTSWRRVLALALVFVMMFSIMGTSGYSVFAEDLPETSEEVVVSEPEAVTPEVTVDDQGPSPGAEEVTEPVEPAAADEEPVEAVEEAAEVKEAEEPAEAAEEAEEAEESAEEDAEPVEPTEEAIEDEEVEEPAEAAEEAEESEELELVEEEEDPEEEAVSEDSSEPTLVEEASQIVAEDDGSECEDPEAVAEPSVISDTAQLILDALTQEGEAALGELSEEELLEEPEVFFTDTMTKELERVIVTAIPSEGAFREKVNMSVVPIPDKSRMYLEAEAALAESGVSYDGMLAYDISFRNEAGDLVEPEASVSITMEITDKALAAVNSDNMDVESLMVTHIGSEVTEAVADVADETDGSVTVSMSEDVVDGIAAEFVVDSFSMFVLSWTNQAGEEAQAKIYWGYMDGDTFKELEEGSTVTLDTTAATVSLENTYAGYYCIGATYKENASSDAVDLTPPRLIRTETGWQITTVTHNEDDSTTTNTINIVDGSEIHVIYGTVSGTVPSGSGDAAVPAPKTAKSVTPNGDGTYKIRLEVTGTEVEETEQVGANVLVVLDRTTSMSWRMGNRTRLQVAKAAIGTLVEALDTDTNDIQLALVAFASTGTVVQTSGEIWTSDGDAFMTTVNAVGQQSGTNWESGLYYARQALNSRDSDATYVIFLTDGEPNRRGTTSAQNANTATAISYALTQAQAITALNGVSLYGIFCGSDSGYNNLDNMIRNAGGVTTINGTNEDDIEEAFSSIASTIVSNLGASNVAVDDGIPSLSGVSSNVPGEPSGYTYYIKTADATDWAPWEDAPGAIYSNDNGVTWDLSAVGVLPEGASYAVEFDVWPSQAAYDLIADLNNGIKKYEDLTPAEKATVTGSKETGYSLVTNTHLNTTYSFNGTEYSDKPVELPKEAMPLPTQTISVQKVWNNFIDQANPPDGVTLILTKDGEDYLYGDNAIEVSKTTGWKKDDIYISLGQIKTTEDGYEILETGHDYEIVEFVADEGGYRWELTSEIYHPMVIDGTATMLIKDDNATGTEGTNYYVIGDKDTKYKVAAAGDNTLKAWNDRRSWLQIEKKVTGTGAPADALFEFTVKINDANKEDVWYSAYGPDGIIKDLETSGTAETGDTGYYYASSGTAITVKLQAGWTLRFLNLPSGTTYTVEETGFPDGFAFVKAEDRQVVDTAAVQDAPARPTTGLTTSGTINVPNVEFYVDYTNKYEETSVTVTKTWADGNDQDGIRPDDLTLTLNGLPEGTTVPNPAIAKNGNNWTYTWSNLPKYVGGEEVTYTVSENTVPEGYVATGSPANPDGTITNSHTPVTTNVSVEKVWSDNNDQDGIRPNDLTLTLNGLPNGTTVPNPTIVKDGNNWTYTWSNLPKYVDGEEVTYTVSENTVPEGYEVTGSPANPNGTITNSHNPATIDISATKVWNDANNQDGKREDVTFILKANETAVDEGKTIAKDATGTALTVTWTDQPVYAGGTKIVYTLEEEGAVDGKITMNGAEYTVAVSGSAENGFTVRNSHTPATTEVTVTKEWVDGNNQDGIRPDDLTLTLNGLPEGTTAPSPTITKNGNNWTYTWSNLPENIDGEAVTYTVSEETVPTGYSVTGSPANPNGKITNSHTPATIDISATKVWDDSNNQDGKRDDVTFILKAGGTAVDTGKKISKTATGDDLKVTWTELPVYAAGKKIEYTVEEAGVENGKITMNGVEYTVEVSGNATNGFTIKNSYTPAVTTVTVTKDWEGDYENVGETRPESITVTLSGTYNVDNTEKSITISGAEATITPTEDGLWSYTWTGLPVNAEGEAITYAVKETTVTGYTPTIGAISGSAENGFSFAITNTYSATPVIVDPPVQKVITGTEELYNKGNFTFTIANTAKPEGVTAPMPENTTITNSANYERKDKPAFYEFGEIEFTIPGTYTYTVTESGSVPCVTNDAGSTKTITFTVTQNADGQLVVTPTTDQAVFTFTNVYADVSVTVQKVWDDANNQDGKRPASITVQLKANGQAKGDPIELNEDNKWSATVEKLPVYEDGVEINYTWEEDKPAGYSLSTKTEETVTTLTNSYTPGKTSVNGTKTWNDENNQDGKRPASITVNLLADGEVIKTVTVGEAEKWQWEFTGLPEYSNGKKITYTVEEAGVENGKITMNGAEYTVTVDGYNITNTHAPEKINVTVTKTWSDYDNQYNTRPQSITVQLYANGKVCGDPVTIKADNAGQDGKWTYTYTGLDKYEAGEEIVYTVTEEAVSGYTTTVNGLDITNSYVRNNPSRPPKDPVEEPDEPIEDPDTPLAPIEEDPEEEIPADDTPFAPYEEEPDESIDEEPTPFSPYTGDDRHTAAWGFVSLMSLAGIVVVARRRREEE